LRRIAGSDHPLVITQNGKPCCSHDPSGVLFRIRGEVVAILGVFDGRRDLAELILKRALDPLPFDEL